VVHISVVDDFGHLGCDALSMVMGFVDSRPSDDIRA
jgi:hypothetical protein